jgi:hypothetical protein
LSEDTVDASRLGPRASGVHRMSRSRPLAPPVGVVMECGANDQWKQLQVEGSERPHWVETVDRIRRERDRI